MMNLDTYVNENKALIFSTLFMLACVMLAGYSVKQSRLNAYAADLKVAKKALLKQETALKEIVKIAEAKGAEKKIVNINYLPRFLNSINELAKRNKVIIRELYPDSVTGVKYNLKFITDYYTFLKFISDLESLDITLNDLQVRPYQKTREKTTHVITFSLVPRNDAKEITTKRLVDLKAKVVKPGQRNPFQRFHYSDDVIEAIDLTWIYKLSGIGKTVSNVDYATIDKRNYIVEDILDGKRITRIAEREVHLEGVADKTLKYIITFRNKR